MKNVERTINRRQRRWAKADAADRAAFINAALDTREGRKFFLWLLELGKVGTQPFTANALTTAFSCGELNVGNQILALLLDVNAAGYVQMMKERDNERDNRNRAIAEYYRDDADADTEPGERDASGGTDDPAD